MCHLQHPIAAFLLADPNLPLLVDKYVQPLATRQTRWVFVLTADNHPLHIIGIRSDVSPPIIQLASHLRQNLRMLIDHIVLLQRIGLEIVELSIFKQSPALPEHLTQIPLH